MPGVYLTFGPSVRFVPAPNSYSVGEFVAVPVNASGVTNPPAMATHQTLAFQLDLGIALDLGTAVSAAGSVLSAFGGK